MLHRFPLNSSGLCLPESCLQISTGERQAAYPIISELYGGKFREYAAATSAAERPVEVHRADFGALALSMVSYGKDLIIEPEDFGASLFVATLLEGKFKIFSGGFTHSGGIGTTAIISSADRPRFRYRADAKVLKLRADRQRLETLCWQLLGRKGREDLRFRVPVDDSTLLQRWLALLAYIVSTLASGPVPNRLEACVEETLMMTLLTGQRHNYSDEFSGAGQSIAPRQWRRAVAFMEANLCDSITLAEIAEAAGCSIRSLTRAFRDFKDTTPMRHLLELRLLHVHEELRTAGPAPRSITLIALHWGFRHLGEFNRHYLARFGETPSQTRAKNSAIEYA